MINTSPRYRQVYEAIRGLILNGSYKEGDYLPSENELCAKYKLTRPTVRHALDSLVNDGLITKKRGKGSVVLAIPNGIGILSISGTTSALGNTNLETRIITKPVIHTWPSQFMFPLSETELKNKCIYMERLRLVDHVPVFFDVNYLPAPVLPRFTNRNMANKSLFEILNNYYGLEIKSGEQRIRAISADERMSELFQIPKGEPVLHLERKLNTNRHGVRIYSSIYCNTREHVLYGTF